MSDKIVGIVPAAGKGSRLAPFPCPKELFPVGYQDFEVNGVHQKRPKVVSQYLIENIIDAGAGRILFIVGDGKIGYSEILREWFKIRNRYCLPVPGGIKRNARGTESCRSLDQRRHGYFWHA